MRVSRPIGSSSVVTYANAASASTARPAHARRRVTSRVNGHPLVASVSPMISAFSGFALIGVIVLAGWVVRRWVALPENAEDVIGRLVYAVLAPCLLFDVVSRADLHVLFSEPLLVSAAAASACFGVFLLTVRGRDRGTRIMGAMASGYTNANYIGLPVATYVLHDAAL